MKKSQELLVLQDTVQTLEAEQRTDLGVHLYLTALLHRVNPLWPKRRWASWPRDPRATPDQSIEEFYEDPPYDNSTFGEHEVLNESYPALGSCPESDDDTRVSFKRAPRLAQLHNKYQRRTGPKAVLLNELHALLQEKMRLKLKKNEVLDLLVEESEVMRIMTMKLANRVARVVQRLRRQQKRAPVQRRMRQQERPPVQRNWQDMLICDLQLDKLRGNPNLRRATKLYEKCRAMFRDPDYKYEYDEAEYNTGSSDHPEEVPAFDVTEHLKALYPNPIDPSLDPHAILRQRDIDFHYKENLYVNLWTQASRMKKLSWEREPVVPLTPTPRECEDTKVLQARQRELTQVALSAEDFLAPGVPQY